MYNDYIKKILYIYYVFIKLRIVERREMI